MSEQNNALLAMLKTDLGISTVTSYDGRLAQLLTAAQAAIVKEGASTLDTSDPLDMQLIVMYAAWLWRRRDTMEGMPRGLRYQLNNRVLFDFGEVTDG